MLFEENLPLRGDFELRIFRDGKLEESYRDHNMIMTVARTALAWRRWQGKNRHQHRRGY